MRKGIEQWKAHMVEYNQYTIEQWAGDTVLSTVLKYVHVTLLLAFPHFQGPHLVITPRKLKDGRGAARMLSTTRCLERRSNLYRNLSNSGSADTQ